MHKRSSERAAAISDGNAKATRSIDPRVLFERLSGFGGLFRGSLSAFGKAEPRHTQFGEDQLEPADFQPLALDELANIDIRKDLFPDGALRSISWEILVALYSGEESQTNLAEKMGYTPRECMNAAYLRHFECLEAAKLLISERDGKEASEGKVRLTPEARQMMDTYFRERMARLASS